MSQEQGIRILIAAVGMIVAMTAAIIALFVVQPWGENEATGQVRNYSFCDVSLRTPPGAKAFLSEDPMSGKPVIVALIDRPKGERSSSIEIDPFNGEGVEIRRYTQTPSDGAILDEILSSVGPRGAVSPAWPRDDIAPALGREKVMPGISLQPPDPEAGISVEFLGTSDGTMTFQFKTCKSKASFDLGTGKFNTDGVDVSEAEMFDRLLSEMK